MNHLIKLVIVLFSLMFVISAQAENDGAVKEVTIIEGESTEDSQKEKEAAKTVEEEEEEEPDCD